jgi:hypothetical protein
VQHVDSLPSANHSPSHRPRWLLFGFWFCVVIAIAVVLRRLLALAHPTQGGPAALSGLDTSFASHAYLTIAHIIPAAIFVLLSAYLLFRRGSGQWPERLFFLFGAITGATAYGMSSYAIGGWVERSAVLVFNTWFLFSLSRAYLLRSEPATERVWIIRAVGVLLGIATTRPVMGVFFATSRLTHLTPEQFFGFAFWIGFSINMLVAELWLRSRRRAALYRMSPITAAPTGPSPRIEKAHR